MAMKRSAIASSEAIAERYQILHYLSRLFSGGPLALPSDLKVAEVNGARLAYGELGTGQLVVFVHGSISDRTICHAQLPAVAARYRTIAFSRRYAQPYHDLPRGDKDTAHLVGASNGAYICLRAAIREPLAVRTLELEKPPLATLAPRPSPSRIPCPFGRHPW